MWTKFALYFWSLINLAACRIYAWTARRTLHPNHPFIAHGRDMPDAAIEYVFTDTDGKRYYKFCQPFELPCHRAELCLRAYGEFEAKVTNANYEALLLKCLAFADKKMAVTEFVEMVNGHLRTCRSSLEPSALLRMAAVMFFDDSESPYYADSAAIQRKMTRWAESKHAHFFLCAPLMKLAVWQDSLEDTFQSYFRIITVQAMTNLERVEAGLPLSEEIGGSMLPSDSLTNRISLQKAILARFANFGV